VFEQMLVFTDWVPVAGRLQWQIGLDFRTLPGLVILDVTGQPVSAVIPDPNILVVLVLGTPAQLDMIQSDPRYTDRILPGSREPVLTGAEDDA